MNSRFELECTDCSFRTKVVGEFDEVFDDIEAHREEQSAGPTEHFVNIHRIPVANGSDFRSAGPE